MMKNTFHFTKTKINNEKKIVKKNVPFFSFNNLLFLVLQHPQNPDYPMKRPLIKMTLPIIPSIIQNNIVLLSQSSNLANIIMKMIKKHKRTTLFIHSNKRNITTKQRIPI